MRENWEGKCQHRCSSKCSSVFYSVKLVQKRSVGEPTTSLLLSSKYVFICAHKWLLNHLETPPGVWPVENQAVVPHPIMFLLLVLLKNFLLLWYLRVTWQFTYLLILCLNLFVPVNGRWIFVARNQWKGFYPFNKAKGKWKITGVSLCRKYVPTSLPYA